MRSLPFLLIASLTLVLVAGEAEADELLPLAGGPDWYEVDNEPPEVGDGALGVTWNQTGVETDALTVSIVGQAGGYSPSDPEVLVGVVVTWTNDDTLTHTVTDKDEQFDSFDLAPGETWSMTFTELGVFNYYCKYHPAMEGSITVLSDVSARTSYIEVWTAESYLVFWANFSMSNDSTINVTAQEKGYDLDSPQTVNLTENNGFSIVSVSNGTVMGDSLKGDTDDEWKKYQIYLDSGKLGYNGLDYDPHEDNAYSFVFSIRGIEGSAAIGGVQLIRDLDTGFYFGKADHETLKYDIFPSLTADVDYFAKNIGTEDNTFRMNPKLDAQGQAYDGAPFDIYIMVRMNGEEFDEITASSNDDGTWTHEFDMAPDDEAVITIHIIAPDYDATIGEPAGNRKFDVVLNAYDTGSDDELREPMPTSLFIRPSQFVLGEMTFDSIDVLEGVSLNLTVRAWNEGNYATDVLVVFYVLDSTANAYSTPNGVQRMTRIASTAIPLMAPTSVLEDQDYQTWYYATATWEETFIPDDTELDYKTVSIYALINPQLEQQDLEAGFTKQDEYLNLGDDNDADGEIVMYYLRDILPEATTNFSVNFVDDVVNLDVSPGASGTACTEIVIFNLGTITIDVDVSLSGDTITISPSAVSVTLAPEGNITVPICALGLSRTEARIVQVSALASGRETNTQLNQVNVISNFTAIVDSYARLSIQASPPAKHCIGSTFWTNFTGANNGNANDIVVFEVSNIQELEDAGFTFTLPILQYQLEPASVQNLVIKVDGENVAEGYYNMIVTIATTMDGESFSAAATYQIWMANCQEQEANIEDDSLPSISLIPALITIGIIALRRRS